MSEYTREVEVQLFRAAQAGDAASVAQLLRQYEPLVHRVLREQWHPPGWEYGEAAQAGRMGLWRAILKYDPGRGVPFTTYAWRAIARHIWRAAKVYARNREEPHGLWENPPQVDAAAHLEQRAIQREVRRLVAALPVRQAWLVQRHYGLDGRGGCTQAQLAERWGCTRQAVHDQLARARDWLRHPAHHARLRAWIGEARRAAYRRALRPRRRRR